MGGGGSGYAEKWVLL